MKSLPKELLEMLVCPRCKGTLTYDEKNQELICKKSKIAFPIIDSIPIMLIDKAKKSGEC